ncbi:MAG: pilus assembly protein PilM [Verrucomicrobia bacterium]|nr:pilus assembly protein PilM [Verrucomicrobiota bacterium]MCF7709494.1 pilus assembly protein PilM [Verrucomicrobiota bacterium]
MDLSLLSAGRKKAKQIAAIDLGVFTTKAVYVERKGNHYSLSRYVVVPTPKGVSSGEDDAAAAHFKRVFAELDAKTKHVILAVGMEDSFLRHTELPMMPVSDMRVVLKMNSKKYLQQELQDYLFDCHILSTATGQRKTSEENAASLGRAGKYRVLVGGAKRGAIDRFHSMLREAGLIPDVIMPGVIGPVNAFELSDPETFRGEATALVDIGFRNSSINIIANGDFAFNRVVNWGGDRITSSLVDAMGIDYDEAEKQKLELTPEVEPIVGSLLLPLGRELRASIDFFEHQQEKTVSQIFFSGGTAKSSFVLETLQAEMMVPCKQWNPTQFLDLSLPPSQRVNLENDMSLLAVPIGAAASVFQ